MLGTFNNWIIINFTNKTTSKEDIYGIHEVVVHVISDNTVSLLQTGKYGSISKTDPITTGYYFVNFLLYTFILQEDINTNGEVFKAGEITIRSE